jgi:hypothetical protein
MMGPPIQQVAALSSSYLRSFPAKVLLANQKATVALYAFLRNLRMSEFSLRSVVNSFNDTSTVRLMYSEVDEMPPKTLSRGRANQRRGGEGMPRGRPKNEVLAIDKTWLTAQMARAGYRNFSHLARYISLDRAAMLRSLKGERPFTAKDIASMAEALQVTTDEVMRHIGFSIPARGVPISGKVTHDARVSSVIPQKGVLFRAEDHPADAVALVVDAPNGPLSFMHESTLIYRPHPLGEPVPVSIVGTLCIIECDDHLTPFLGHLQKGTSRQTSTLHLFGTGEKMAVSKVHAAAPILAIYFPA